MTVDDTSSRLVLYTVLLHALKNVGALDAAPMPEEASFILPVCTWGTPGLAAFQKQQLQPLLSGCDEWLCILKPCFASQAGASLVSCYGSTATVHFQRYCYFMF